MTAEGSVTTPAPPVPEGLKREEPEEHTASVTSISETDRLDPAPEELKLKSGTTIELQPLRMRQFFKLLRVVTRGGATMLTGVQLSPNMDQEEFAAQFLAILMFSLPEADEEAVEFLRSMVKPKGLTGRTDPASRQLDEDAVSRVYAELDNPELEDVVTIVQAIVRREAADLQALGKRVLQAWTLAQKTGQM